jgi:hypothetical protein
MSKDVIRSHDWQTPKATGSLILDHQKRIASLEHKLNSIEAKHEFFRRTMVEKVESIMELIRALSAEKGGK